MVRITLLTEDDAKRAIETGDFAKEIRASKTCVAIVLTQDWCPQWTSMKSWMKALEAQNDASAFDLDIYELEYNRMPSFGAFMSFKENEFGNNLIPYVRYYRGGELIDESNYVSKEVFLQKFGAC